MPQDTITENVDLVKYKARAEGIRTDYTSLEIRVVGGYLEQKRLHEVRKGVRRQNTKPRLSSVSVTT
jgi:hypothetical protein